MVDNRAKVLLRSYNHWETDSEKIEYIEKLETFIGDCNEAVRGGTELVPDSVYDTCIDILRDIAPGSYLLKRTWSDTTDGVSAADDLDTLLLRQPMYSIQTIKSMDDSYIEKFRTNLEALGGAANCHVSYKENGHGIRLVYKDGHLVRATSRGRGTTDRKDLTRQLQTILPNQGFKAEMATLGLVEVRGELLLPFANLTKAREFNPAIKSAFSGVSSMLRDSATPEEWGLLDFVAYEIVGTISFGSRSAQYATLISWGFKVPVSQVFLVKAFSLEQDLQHILDTMSVEIEKYPYYTDGLVVEVDDKQAFDRFGAEDKVRLGNLALKMGYWEQNMYSGVVGKVNWINGKSKKTPVIELAKGVLTATGNTVVNVPVYAPCYLLMMEAYPGNTVYFRYGGEAGVVPCLSNGKLITDKTDDN